MVKKILIGLLVVVVGILVAGAFQPSDYTVVRQVTISAPAEKIFPYLNNVKMAEMWGPWSEVDPKAQMVHSGPAEGVGATTSWASEGQLGTGSATIVDVIPNQRVGVKLEYTKPMTMVQDSEYLISVSGDQSTVSWKVTGQKNYISRVMCLFMDMDKMVGSMFEKGLTNLKTLVEKQ